MVIADSSLIIRMSREGMSMNLDVNVRKTIGEHHNICGEEFQRVIRTIFIKLKMLLFPYTLIISTRILKILTFFTKS